MIMSGSSITAKDDILQKIKVEYLYHKIQHPNSDIEARIRQLRIVKQLDSKQYSTLKRQLPYVVCGIYNPAIRRTENFAYTEYFILDIDHIQEKDLSATALKTRLKADSRVVMCFNSPGEDGLKLLFQLKEKCFDPGIYSLFYKVFLSKFALEYQLDQVLDTRTSDVTRACFISSDPDAYYNPLADTIDINIYINSDNVSEMFRQKKEIENYFPDIVEQKDKEKSGIDEEAIAKVKSILNPDIRKTSQKQEAFVPAQLDDIMEGLTSYIEQTGIVIKNVCNINYGKKIEFQTGIKQAEINLFYGKKGYSVVQSPRRGTNAELNQLMADLILQYVLMM